MKRIAQLFAFVILTLSGMASPLAAQSNMPPAPYAYTQLDDPELEETARELMYTLRCLQCQSQSIADSDAPVAGDMRHQVRTRLAGGESPEEVRAYLISRYGDYISYEPEISATTWPLFVLPGLLVLIAIAVLVRRVGKARA